MTSLTENIGILLAHKGIDFIAMLKNYINIALRNINKHKCYSLINITGLAIGMACCILILLWVQDELDYDKFHENSNYLYRIAREVESGGQKYYQATAPAPLSLALKNEVPEIIRSSRFSDEGEKLIKYGDKSFQNDIVALADPDFFEMFTFPLIKGDPTAAFADRYSVIITEQMSQKYFGAEDPIGKVISIDRKDFTVTGIMRNVPHNSHMQFDFIVPFSSRSERIRKLLNSWRVHAYYTYVQLNKNAGIIDVNRKMSALISRNTDKKIQLSLQPLTRIHLYHDVQDFLKGHGDIKYVYLFSALALLILVIACFNFMNLTTARSEDRAKEVGIRKVVGANKTNLIEQFLGESGVLAFIALIFAIVLIELSLPAFSAWSQKPLSFDFSDSMQILLSLAGVLLITGFIAGSYPALILSSFKPVEVLKGRLKSKRGGSTFRRILVSVQFALSVFLIISTSIIHNQLEYIRNRDLGFDKQQLVSLYMEGDFRSNYEAIKSELLQDPAILDVTAGTSPTRRFDGVTSVKWNGRESDKEIVFDSLPVDYGFIETLGMRMLQGRSFSRNFPSDAKEGFIINETASKMIGTESQVGKRFSFISYGNNLETIDHQGTIIGVAKDFHNLSLHNKIAPLVMYLDQTKLHEMCIRINPDKVADAIALLKRKWKEFVPQYPFEFHFIDETIDSFYRAEQRLGTIFNFFTILAIFVSCLGLFGLTSFMAKKRTKEIGIRKVLGASISGIVSLLLKEFMALVLFANIIALPIAYFTMNKWLQNFAYKTNIGILTLVLSAALVLIIALLTVSYQSIKAAVANPVESLRYE